MTEGRETLTRLSEADKRHIKEITLTFANWTHGNFAPPLERGEVEHLRDYALIENYFFSGYVVGSVLNPAKKPNDIDLLVATNLFPNTSMGVGRPMFQPEFTDLLYALCDQHVVGLKMYREGKKFSVRFNPRNIDGFSVMDFLRGEYGSKDCTQTEIDHYDRNTDARLTINIDSLREDLLPVDLIYQWDITSDGHWERHEEKKQDREPFMKLFRIGAENPKGKPGMMTREHYEWFGARGVPIEKYRIRGKD